MVNKKHNGKILKQNKKSSQKHLCYYEMPGATNHFRLQKVCYSIYFLVCLFKQYSATPCVVTTMTCWTKNYIIVIPWAIKAVTSRGPHFLTAHYTGVGWMFTMETTRWYGLLRRFFSNSCLLYFYDFLINFYFVQY